MRGAILKLTAAALAAALAGCADKAPPKKTPVDVSLIQPDCYTVDPYQKLRIAKAPQSLPVHKSAFLGGWGGGAWGGRVCHDLYVLKVDEAGEAILFDAHGPGFSTDATAFTRRGLIGEDGRLRVRKGRAEVEYWIEDGRMHGLRRVGRQVTRIIMTPKAS